MTATPPGSTPENLSPADSRRVVSLSTGSRICLLIGALLVLGAAYLFWAPIEHSVPNSFPAKCGSAAKPPSDSLGKAVCGSVNEQRRLQALTLLGAAVVVAGGGVVAFGVTRVEPLMPA